MPYLGLIYLVVLVVALIDIISTDEWRIRSLPKAAWVLLVVLLPLVGAVLWVALGRPNGDAPALAHRRDPRAEEFPEYDRPGRHVAADPEADREFLRQVRERAEAQRRRHREQERARREAEEHGDG